MRRLEAGSGGAELCVVAAYFGPGAGEVVGHEVDVVDDSRDGIQIDVFEDILPDGKSSGDEIFWLRKSSATLPEELHIVTTLFRILRMLPVNYKSVSN